MNNHQRFHLIACVIFFAIGIYFNNIYKLHSPNFLSEMGLDLVKIPIIISILYIFRRRYLFSSFWKDVLLLLGFQLVIHIPDFWISFENNNQFILYKILGLSAGALVAYIVYGVYEKSFILPV